MVVFVIALESEAEPILARFEDSRTKEVYGRKVVYGKLCGKETAAMICGVGKVNAAAGCEYAIDVINADKIVNIGVAGGLNGGMRIASVYGISEVVQYDFDLAQLNGTPTGTLNEYEEPYIKVNALPLYPLKKLATGDRFNDDKADYNLLTGELNADIRDMEFGAIAHVCRHADVKCYSFKAISDIAGNGSTTEQFLINLQRCKKTLEDEAERIFAAVCAD